MKYQWIKCNKFNECKAFIEGDTLFVRREADGEWSSFSKFCGWQSLYGVNIEAVYKRSEKKFYSGDSIEWVF